MFDVVAVVPQKCVTALSHEHCCTCTTFGAYVNDNPSLRCVTHSWSNYMLEMFRKCDSTGYVLLNSNEYKQK